MTACSICLGTSLLGVVLHLLYCRPVLHFNCSKMTVIVKSQLCSYVSHSCFTSHILESKTRIWLDSRNELSFLITDEGHMSVTVENI